MKKFLILITCNLLLTTCLLAQTGLVNTASSPYAKMNTVGLTDVQLTKGFWAERFAVCRDVMLPQLWKIYTSDTVCYSFKNFKIAAGLDTGRFRGPSFHDGDFYKTLEAVAAMYASTKDKKLEQWLNNAIEVIAKAQKADGYIYTKNIIEQRKTGKDKMFDDQLSFEAYNFGHLITAGCIHYRATGKKDLLNIATKAADFLIDFYKVATPEQARNAICPSHYMGLVELYRTIKEKKYLDLVNYLINIRGTVEGTDDNSDRAPFRKMNKIVGHAVRANYLCAGVADVYAETGDTALLKTLDKLWHNVAETKMYITGGCGALYDGVSVDGTSYKPDTVQRVHQAYGRDFQLPNITAYNETCANIGNVLWNWRMFLLTGESKYIDIVELTLYNSVLSGVSLNGINFFYTNPLASSKIFPYNLRWQGERSPYISKSNCCPPNVVRTMAEIANYMYSVAQDGLYINMYSSNSIKTNLKDGSVIAVQQTTNYPWSGNINLAIQQAPTTETAIYVRIPDWCTNAIVKINGVAQKVQYNAYTKLFKTWKAGDKIELILSMPAVLMESNPLVEESKNQVAVKRGPLVYCIESADIKDASIFDVVIPAKIKLSAKPINIAKTNVVGLQGTAQLLQNNKWKNSLYKPFNTVAKPINITLIPYYAWANRGRSDMSVWLPVVR